MQYIEARVPWLLRLVAHATLGSDAVREVSWRDSAAFFGLGCALLQVAMPEDCPHVFSSAAVDGKGMVYFTCNTAGPGIDSAEGEDFPSGVGILFSINPTLHMEG
jgi:hypothetical protein